MKSLVILVLIGAVCSKFFDFFCNRSDWNFLSQLRPVGSAIRRVRKSSVKRCVKIFVGVGRLIAVKSACVNVRKLNLTLVRLFLKF